LQFSKDHPESLPFVGAIGKLIVNLAGIELL